MKLIAELPDPAALADVSEERLRKLWQGLGYYSRARNLHQCARQLDEFMLKHDMLRVSYFPTLQGSKVVSDMTSFDDFDHA